MVSLSYQKKLKLFKHLTLHLDDILNIDIPYFESMVSRIYPRELQLILLMRLIQKPLFGLTFIYFKRTFKRTFMRNATTLNTVLISLNLFDLLECLVL